MYKKGFYTFRGTSVLLTSKDFAEIAKLESYGGN
jgi:hypothetical protein